MTREHLYEDLEPDRAERWLGYGKWEREYYPKLVGFHAELVKRDFCRMRLNYKPSLDQPAGVVHGGAIASLIDSVVVPAIGSAYDANVNFVTVNLQVQYLGALVQEDAIAEPLRHACEVHGGHGGRVGQPRGRGRGPADNLDPAPICPGRGQSGSGSRMSA